MSRYVEICLLHPHIHLEKESSWIHSLGNQTSTVYMCSIHFAGLLGLAGNLNRLAFNGGGRAAGTLPLNR